jgi:histone deacetylase 6
LNDAAQESEQYESVYLTPHSYDEAKAASNGLCELVRLVLQGELQNGFAVIRPPGHHAEPSCAGGYCILNHVAIAARYAQSLSFVSSSGSDDPPASPAPRMHHRVDRVLIVDWDVHHGNGTQSIFESDSSVMYFSVHRWHSGRYYPHHSNGGPTNVGLSRRLSDGSSAAGNVNVGWTNEGMGDDEYRAVWQVLLLPMAREFQPDLVLVSAGFDAAAGDVGDCHVTPQCFAFLTKQLQRVAGGRVVCSLEGGYVRSVLSACVTRVVEALLSELDGNGEVDFDADGTNCSRAKILESIDPIAAQNIRSTMEAHRPYWSCLS